MSFWCSTRLVNYRVHNVIMRVANESSVATLTMSVARRQKELSRRRAARPAARPRQPAALSAGRVPTAHQVRGRPAAVGEIVGQWLRAVRLEPKANKVCKGYHPIAVLGTVLRAQAERGRGRREPRARSSRTGRCSAAVVGMFLSNPPGCLTAVQGGVRPTTCLRARSPACLSGAQALSGLPRG